MLCKCEPLSEFQFKVNQNIFLFCITKHHFCRIKLKQTLKNKLELVFLQQKEDCWLLADKLGRANNISGDKKKQFLLPKVFKENLQLLLILILGESRYFFLFSTSYKICLKFAIVFESSILEIKYLQIQTRVCVCVKVIKGFCKKFFSPLIHFGYLGEKKRDNQTVP